MGSAASKDASSPVVTVSSTADTQGTTRQHDISGANDRDQLKISEQAKAGKLVSISTSTYHNFRSYSTYISAI